jgi:hypothetical protein
MESLHFTVEGGFITNHFRNLCLEGEWSKALNQLQQSLIGFPMDLAIKVLSGEKRLEGENNEMTLEDDPDSSEYREKLLSLYGRRIYRHGVWYKPMAIINTIYEDCEMASERARIYCPDYDSYMFLNGTMITLEKTADSNPPVWLEETLRKEPMPEVFLRGVVEYGVTESDIETYGSEDSMVREIVEYQTERGFLCDEYEVSDFMDLDFVREEIRQRKKIRAVYEERKAEAYYAELREKIFEQAEESGGFMTIKACHGEKEYRVPRAPFLKWCYTYGSHMIYQGELLPEWEPVSPSGLKMGGDNRYHTDYVIGAGFGPHEFYDNDDFKSAAFDALNNELELDLITVTGSGKIVGSIHKISEDTDPEYCRDKIIVIPHAGVEYFEHSKVARLTIAEIGGPGSHLAINAAEFDIKLILIENARKILEKDEIEFDLDNQTYVRTDNRES